MKKRRALSMGSARVRAKGEKTAPERVFPNWEGPSETFENQKLRKGGD